MAGAAGCRCPPVPASHIVHVRMHQGALSGIPAPRALWRRHARRCSCYSESKHSTPPALHCPPLICPIRKCGRLHARRRGTLPAMARMHPANLAAIQTTSARGFSSLHTDGRGMACTGSAISAMCTDAGTDRHQKCGITRVNTAWAHGESA